MKLLALGDIIRESGCEFVRRKLPLIKKEYGIDVCIANGENSAAGNGINANSADYLISSGVDFITTGNHIFRQRDIYSYLDEHDYIIRPYNLHHSTPGRGVGIIDMGRYRIGVINLMGNAFFNANYENCFDAFDKAINEISDCKIKIVDFHAEATGEKKAMGFYADGRVSAFFGTHTHIQTADAQILPKGTGYITDLGMCGSDKSVLGIKPEIIISSLKTGMPSKFEPVDDDIMINGCIFEIDEKTGFTVGVTPVTIK
ncbi:MAG: TIGR00282 family metallophosphoesterase [Ruminococcus sp.]|nr:TIGR00282 family metallophosphoesterase [Candidatus Copronaster equi]